MVKKPTYEELEESVKDLQNEVRRLKGVEEKSRENERKFRFIVENSIDAIWQTDLSNKVTYISPSTLDIGGYTPEEVMGFENALELYDDETRILIMTEIGKYLQKPVDELKLLTIPRIEGSGFHKDGHKIWIEIQAKFVFQEDRIVGLQGITRDISERKKAEIALLKNEQLLKTVIESTEDGILAVDKDGKTIAANSRFREMWGIPEEVYHKRDDKEMLRFVLDQLKEPDQFLLKVQNLYQETKEDLDILNFKDGRIFERYSRPMRMDGEFIGRVWSFRDVTKRMQADTALRESERRFRTLVNNLPVAVYQNTPGPKGEFLMVNPAFCRILGYENEEEVKKVSVAEIYANPEERKKFSDTLMEKGIIEIDERMLLKKDGTPVYTSVTASATRWNDGEVHHFDCIFMDITEQKKLKSQLLQAQKMEAIGKLAGGVAHDLNNILSGLVSYPELLLLQLPENSTLRNPILTIKKSGEKAAAVVQDLLTLARRGVVVTDVVNLNDVISEYLKSPEHEKILSFHPDVHLVNHLKKSVFNILGSSTHLSKAVMNLISNAAEAMPEGGTISISTENRYIDGPIRGYDNVKEGDYVVLTVSDTGAGISPEDLERIFEPFYTKKKMGRSGTGLGTTVVWGTVKDHNGYIDIQSGEGKGTTFTLYFPASRKKMPETESSLPVDFYCGNGESILIVDDVEEQRQIVLGMLKELGYSALSVSSGEEAVEYLKKNKVDIVLLDMIMDPGMDGLDTYKQILELHPGQKAIIASGFSETDRVKEFESLGTGGYIKKPFLLEKIGLAIKEELEK